MSTPVSFETLIEYIQALSPEDLGTSREDALVRLHDLVTARLAKAEIVPVKIRSTQSDNLG
jgi:hypothetical protein